MKNEELEPLEKDAAALGLALRWELEDIQERFDDGNSDLSPEDARTEMRQSIRTFLDGVAKNVAGRLVKAAIEKFLREEGIHG